MATRSASLTFPGLPIEAQGKIFSFLPIGAFGIFARVSQACYTCFTSYKETFFSQRVIDFKLRVPEDTTASQTCKANIFLIKAIPSPTATPKQLMRFINLIVDKDQPSLLDWVLRRGEDSIPLSSSKFPRSLASNEIPLAAIDINGIVLNALQNERVLCLQAALAYPNWRAGIIRDTTSKGLIYKASYLENPAYYQALMKIESYITPERLDQDFARFARQNGKLLVTQDELKQISNDTLQRALASIAENGDLEEFKKLFEHLKASSLLSNEVVGSAFSDALEKKKMDVVRFILQNTLNQIPQKVLQNALSTFARKGHLDDFKQLFNHLEDSSLPSEEDIIGQSLVNAAINDHLTVVEFILESKKLVSFFHQVRAAYNASKHGYLNCLTLILDINKEIAADVIALLLKDKPLKNKPSRHQKTGRKVDCFKALLKKLPPDVKTDPYFNLAALGGHTEYLQVFIESTSFSDKAIDDVLAEAINKKANDCVRNFFRTPSLISKCSIKTIESALKWTQKTFDLQDLQLVISSPQFPQVGEDALNDVFLNAIKIDDHNYIHTLMNSCPISRFSLNSLGFAFYWAAKQGITAKIKEILNSDRVYEIHFSFRLMARFWAEENRHTGSAALMSSPDLFPESQDIRGWALCWAAKNGFIVECQQLLSSGIPSQFLLQSFCYALKNSNLLLASLLSQTPAPSNSPLVPTIQAWTQAFLSDNQAPMPHFIEDAKFDDFIRGNGEI